MANVLMNSGRQGFADAAIDWNTDTIKCVALDADYTFSAAHDFLDDIAAGARISTATLTSPTLTDGVLNSAAIVFSAPASGDTITQFMIFKDTGTEATSRLIYFMDTDSGGSPFSIATNDTDITLNPSGSGWVKI